LCDRLDAPLFDGRDRHVAQTAGPYFFSPVFSAAAGVALLACTTTFDHGCEPQV